MARGRAQHLHRQQRLPSWLEFSPEGPPTRSPWPVTVRLRLLKLRPEDIPFRAVLLISCKTLGTYITCPLLASFLFVKRESWTKSVVPEH